MKKIALAAVALALVVGMLALAGCSCSSNASSSASSSSSSASASSSTAPKDVIVPDLKGKTQSDAEKALSDVGLIGVASNPEESTEVEPGQVFKQSVAPGAKAKEGDIIAFTVAIAPAEVEVPDVTGKTREEAKKAITDAKLGFDATVAFDDKVEKDKVISQSVAAGTKVKSGTTVSVVVSLGVKPASDVEVPDVMTYSRDEAEATMKSAGLAVSFVGDSDGNVVGQDIAAGTKVAPGTTVTLTLQDPDPGQNPMMNFIGKYGCDRATAQVDAVGEDGGRVTVEWPSSAAETSEWVMEGTFNADTMKLKYKDGTKTEITFDSKGKETRKTVYTDGTGTITFNDDGTLSFTWKDDKEGVAKGMTFTYV